MTHSTEGDRSNPRRRTPSADEPTTCALCGTSHPRRRMAAASGLGRSLHEHLRAAHPERFQSDSRLCSRCLDRERVAFVLGRLEKERGELSDVEADIARKAAQHAIVVEHIDEEFAKKATLGQRVADKVALVGGSWAFLASFFLFLAVWMAWNSAWLRERAFDPYPYILLNLVLSTLAALQAPIIMMSQNRLAARDRAQADQDFRTNLKAEIEIIGLHEKIDHLLHTQFERMVELQEVQISMLEEIAERKRS